jgi:VIT1/CCC1 family predicted Fe2+/Mn2+ transporter
LDFKDNKSVLYEISLYWTITTITTVGYGDISGNNQLERIFCMFVMIIGVAAFTFANGSLASIF